MARRKSSPVRSNVTRLQCACALLGFLVTVFTVCVLARSAFSRMAPPNLSAHAVSMRHSTIGWIVEVTVTNQGDLTAAGVEIQGKAGSESVGTTLDYVPGHGAKKATLVFAVGERPEPQLRIAGWSEP